MKFLSRYNVVNTNHYKLVHSEHSLLGISLSKNLDFVLKTCFLRFMILGIPKWSLQSCQLTNCIFFLQGPVEKME